MRGVQRPSPLASITPAYTAGPPSQYWNLKCNNSDTMFSTHHTTILTSSSSNYHTCSVLGNTSALTRALSTSPFKEQPIPSFQHHSCIKCPLDAHATHPKDPSLPLHLSLRGIMHIQALLSAQ
eukprot:1137690-Pelagomonas_calceolata.AAC.2